MYKPTNTKIDLIKWWHSLNRKSSFIWRKKNWKRRVRLLMEYSLRKWKKRKHKLYLYCNSITYPSISYIKDIWNTGSEFLWEQLYIWPFSHMVKRPAPAPPPSKKGGGAFVSAERAQIGNINISVASKLSGDNFYGRFFLQKQTNLRIHLTSSKSWLYLCLIKFALFFHSCM